MSTKKLIMFAVIGLVLVAVLGVGGLFAYKKFLAPPPPPPPEEVVEEKDPLEGLIGPMFTMSFTVNLADTGRAHYLKLNLDAEFDSADTVKELEVIMPKVKDALITLLSSKTTGELMTVGDKQKLKNEILHRLNSLLSSGKVKEVYFSQFIVQ